MSRISIYVIKEISSSFLFIFSLLTLVIWLSQALKNLELLANASVTISSYTFFSILLIPKLSMMIIPISIFLAIILTLNKLRLDSELIIFGSTGNSNRDILLKPLFIIGLFFFFIILFLSVYLVPKSSAEIRLQITEIRSSSISSSILKEKRFITPDRNLTVFFKKIDDQDIYGLLLHDRSEKNNIKTYIAKRGFFDNRNDNNSIYLYDGTMQIYDEEQNKMSEIEFDSYSINLNNFDKVEKNYFYADERSSLSLMKKILSFEYNNKEFGVFHNRLTRALYIFSLIFLPLIIFKLIKKPDDNAGLIISIIIA
ncbi:LptF/LptG family permease, partial [Pelagibacterales bacterium]|nr:LptF/LptG family permease [Pelagibacterales bacterium]